MACRTVNQQADRKWYPFIFYRLSWLLSVRGSISTTLRHSKITELLQSPNTLWRKLIFTTCISVIWSLDFPCLWVNTNPLESERRKFCAHPGACLFFVRREFTLQCTDDASAPGSAFPRRITGIIACLLGLQLSTSTMEHSQDFILSDTNPIFVDM